VRVTVTPPGVLSTRGCVALAASSWLSIVGPFKVWPGFRRVTRKNDRRFRAVA